MNHESVRRCRLASATGWKLRGQRQLAKKKTIHQKPSEDLGVDQIETAGVTQGSVFVLKSQVPFWVLWFEPLPL